MKNIHFYNIPIAYMLVYTVAILTSGVWIFLLTQGLGNLDRLATLEKIIESPMPKSLHGFVEVATPHIFAMGLLLFVVAHFMLFSTKVSYTFSRKLSLLTFVFALFNIVAYLFILLGLVVSGWIKLVSMFLFVVAFVLLLVLVLLSL